MRIGFQVPSCLISDQILDLKVAAKPTRQGSLREGSEVMRQSCREFGESSVMGGD